MLSGTQEDFWGCSVQGQKLHLMILVIRKLCNSTFNTKVSKNDTKPGLQARITDWSNSRIPEFPRSAKCPNPLDRIMLLDND